MPRQSPHHSTRAQHPRPPKFLHRDNLSSRDTDKNRHLTAPKTRPNETMFGPFRLTSPLGGGLLWKIPWRLSKFQKRRQRQRLRAVDGVVATLDAALSRAGASLASLDRWKEEMPTEAEMLPRDKYTIFDRKEKRYRKGIHSTPALVPFCAPQFALYPCFLFCGLWVLLPVQQRLEVLEAAGLGILAMKARADWSS